MNRYYYNVVPSDLARNETVRLFKVVGNAEGSAITVDVADGAFVFHTTQPEPVAIPEPVAA